MWTTIQALVLVPLVSASMTVPSPTAPPSVEATPGHLTAPPPLAPSVTGRVRERLRRMTATRVTPYLDFGGAAALVDGQQILRPQAPDLPLPVAPTGPVVVSPGVRIQLGAISLAAFVGLPVNTTTQTNVLVGLELR